MISKLPTLKFVTLNDVSRHIGSKVLSKDMDKI
jgi:hypothetical protein